MGTRQRETPARADGRLESARKFATRRDAAAVLPLRWARVMRLNVTGIVVDGDNEGFYDDIRRRV